MRVELEAAKNKLTHQNREKIKIDVGIETDLECRSICEQRPSQPKDPTMLQNEYLKLLKQIKNQNKEVENKTQNVAELQRLTEMIARNKQKAKITALKRKPNKTYSRVHQSMTAMDFNTTAVSNIKSKARASSRLGYTCRKEKGKTRGSCVSSTAIRTERSLRSVTNKIERTTKPEFSLSAKELHTKRNRSHAQTSDNPQLEKRSTQSLLRLTSRIFNQKVKDYAL